VSAGTPRRGIGTVVQKSAPVSRLTCSSSVNAFASSTICATSSCTGGDRTKLYNTTCTLPQDIAVGSSYTCTFDALICGFPHENKVTGTLTDDEGNSLDKSGNATVTGSRTGGPS
jgi:hypothetical protein